jgi:hypothetical protein
MRSNRVELCSWLAWAGEPYELKWDVIERHLDPEQYKWFFNQPLYKVQLVLDTDYRADDQRWIKLIAEFFDDATYEAYQAAWAK